MESTEINLKDYLEEMDRMDSLVGHASASECTFTQGYMPRQAVFSCLDCTPVTSGIKAGFCFACSVSCHKDHKIEEIYTKRHFRCDCGTLPQLLCSLKSEDIAARNSSNKYNQNFEGRYCVCGSTYPNPDCPELDQVEMLQCCVCEDWYHTTHLNGSGVPDNFQEMVCQGCVEKFPFLAAYSVAEEESVDIVGNVTKNQENSEAGKEKLVSKQINESTANNKGENMDNISGDSTRSAIPENSETVSEDSTKRSVDCSSNQKEGEINPAKRKRSNECKLFGIPDGDKPVKALFFDENFRSNICNCTCCLEMYQSKDISFLIDTQDPIFKYEEQATMKRQEEDELLQNTIESLPHQAKCEVARAIGSLHNTIEALVRKAATEGQESVGSKEIKEAFKSMASETNVDPSIFDHI